MIESHTFTLQPLSFYREVLLFQRKLYTSLQPQLEGGGGLQAETFFSTSTLNEYLPLLSPFFPSFLGLIRSTGSEELSSLAGRLSTSTGAIEWEALLDGYWSRTLEAEDPGESTESLFFPKAFLQPFAQLAAEQVQHQGSRVGQGAEAQCPLCGRRPQVGILRAEGEGARRSLMCSLCASEWRYKRVSCPACGEDDRSKLSYHRSADFPHLRLESCDSCKKYMKTVDLTIDGRAVPEVDEVANLPLDLWAVEQGYVKIEINLIGA